MLRIADLTRRYREPRSAKVSRHAYLRVELSESIRGCRSLLPNRAGLARLRCGAGSIAGLQRCRLTSTWWALDGPAAQAAQIAGP